MGASYGWGADVDVCEDTCHEGANGGWDYCSAGCPCNAGEGDCNGDAECAPGLICAHDAGATCGWSSEIDVCEPPTMLTLRLPASDVDTAADSDVHTRAASFSEPDEHAPRHDMSVPSR